jgi:glucose uptake protein
MFIVENYILAVFFCFITMLCWGSWANTQKMAEKHWQFALFYWDYVLGIFIFSLLGAFTLGSYGEGGRSFLDDIAQVDLANLCNAFLGGVIFNLANILLVAAISGAGMAVAFPLGIGLALIIGVLLNYQMSSKGSPVLLFSGVLLICLAILLNAIAYSKRSETGGKKPGVKWIAVSVLAGILMSLFYPFVAGGMDLENFLSPAAGKMTPYTAFFVFAAGILVSNFLFNSILMLKPIEGQPVRYAQFFKGRFNLHFWGLLGGLIWGIGYLFNLIAAGKAGPAISYGLGQGATLIAALWGVLIWKEFRTAPKNTGYLIAAMFILFIAGLVLIVLSGV